jgi:hypothetical protein
MTKYKSVRSKSESRKVELANSRTAEALIIFMDAGLMPLEDFRGVNFKWESKCMNCGSIVSPRFADVKGGNGGCKPCGNKSGHTSEFLQEVMQMMTEANLEPLEPYRNSRHKWSCKCLKCGEIVTPTAHNIKAGNGGCVFCQVAAFKHGEAAYLYLIHHEMFAAYKVGIGNYKTVNDRIKSHKKSGWELLEKYSFKKGSTAFEVEKKVLKWIRNEKGLPAHLTNKVFTHGGASETFSDDSITALEIKNKIEDIIKGIK